MIYRCSICGYRGADGHWQRDCPQNPSNRASSPALAALHRRVEEAVGASVSSWPERYRRAATAAKIGWAGETHDSGCGRHVLCAFCVHNGVDAALVVEWLAARGCRLPASLAARVIRPRHPTVYPMGTMVRFALRCRSSSSSHCSRRTRLP